MNVAVSPDIPIALVHVPLRVVAGAIATGAAALASYAPTRAIIAAAGAGAAGSLLYLAATYLGPTQSAHPSSPPSASEQPAPCWPTGCAFPH